MQLFDDRIRMKLWTAKPKEEPNIVGLDGKEIASKRDMTEDDIYFQVMEVGPAVSDVKIGMIIAVAFMSSDMFRMQLPGEDFKSFICCRPSVMGIVRKQP